MAWSELKAEIGELKRAPWSVTIIIFISLGIGAASVAYLESFIIADKDGNIATKEANISLYRDKLNVGSPDEAKKKVDDLEHKLEALTPRRLSQEQQKQIAYALTGTTGAIDIEPDGSANDATLYTSDILSAFGAAGWYPTSQEALVSTNSSKSEFVIFVDDQNNYRQVEKDVMKAFDAAHLKYDIQKDPAPSNRPLGASIAPGKWGPNVRVYLASRQV